MFSISIQFPFVSTKRFHSPEHKVNIVSYHSLSSCSTGILGLLVASVWGEFQNFNTRNDIIPPIAADNKHIQISLDTHISSVSRTLPQKAPVAELDSWRILKVCNWLILTSGQSSLPTSLYVVLYALPLTSALAKLPNRSLIQHVHSILRDDFDKYAIIRLKGKS